MCTKENCYENRSDRLRGTATSSNGALAAGKPVVRYDKKRVDCENGSSELLFHTTYIYILNMISVRVYDTTQVPAVSYS